MATKCTVFPSVVMIANLALFLLILSPNSPVSTAAVKHGRDGGRPFLVKKGERVTTVSTEDGEVSTVRISDGSGWFHIESITLEPDALFLPVLLQSEMVFYVHTGSGNMSWTDESETKEVEVVKGDIYRLQPGTVFYIQTSSSSSSSSSSSDREKLIIYAFFANTENDLHEPAIRPYSSIRHLILGFDKAVLGAAFGVPWEAIEEITGGADPGGIVHGLKKEKKSADGELAFLRALLAGNGYIAFLQGENKKNKMFNVFSNEPDFKSCNGWSTVVSRKQLSALKGIDISVFMVNLTKGSMMGPHWNPRASEFGICLHGQGMVTVLVCPSSRNQTGCKNMRLHVEEGDVFAVPRFHPMAQVAFNNDSFVFMGFSTAAKNNHPQYLAGKASVLQTLDRDILSVSLNAKNTTVDKILNQQEQAIILECTSCAEEEFKVMEEEIQKEKEEEMKKREEEERKKREEEEKKKREEEEEKKREEEEEKKREEEERKKREEEEEEEKKKREEEEKKKREEEKKKREEEERKKREEEEERKKREEEEEEKKKREEEEKKREEEEKKREEEERKKREEEEEREKEEKEREEEEEEEEAKKRQEEEARREEEEARKKEEQRRQEEEAAREAARREEEAKKREEQREKEEEAARREEEEEEAAREKEEEQRQKEEEEAAREAGRREEEARSQEEAAKKKEEEEERHEGPAGTEWGRKVLKKKKEKKDINGMMI